jgi:ATP adenylyltransferase
MENKKLWAPWRINYIQQLGKEAKGRECFLCHDVANPDGDGDNLILWRTTKSIVVMNRFPYNNGHMLIAPIRHIADLDQASDDEMLELMKLVREVKKALSFTIRPDGFNVGINIGKCAGAGLPGHLHIHVVPRWNGDTNFMSVCSDTDVISQSMAELMSQLKKTSKENNLPGLK